MPLPSAFSSPPNLGLVQTRAQAPRTILYSEDCVSGLEAPAVTRALSFFLLRPLFPPNPAVRLAPQHPRTREADGAGGCAESPVHAGDRVPYEASQHSVLKTQAAAGVIRHHFAEQVPEAGSREVSAGPRPRGPGSVAAVGQGVLTYA